MLSPQVFALPPNIAKERGMEINVVLLHPEPVLSQDLLSFTGMCHTTYKGSRESYRISSSTKENWFRALHLHISLYLMHYACVHIPHWHHSK